MEREDEDGVENQICHRARQRADHGELGAAVRADDGVHRLPKHVKGHAQRDIKEILLGAGKRFLIDAAAEHGQDGVHEDDVDRGEDNARGDAQYDGVANAAVRLFRLLPAQANADKRATAVANQYGDGQRDDRQRENHRVRRVAKGAEIVGVGDEDLIDDVVKRRHQQGNDAGNRVFAHQAANRLRFQKGILLFFHI